MSHTSIRVALRVRPLNSKEILQNCSECLTLIPDAPQILIGTDRSFTFDYVFPSDTEQEEVFQECAPPLIDKLIEGQTGSGKTYSMGTAFDSKISAVHQGIIPRAICKLFEDLKERKEKNPSYQPEVYVSFLELYNEDLIDLLNPQSRVNNKKGKNELTIREGANGQIYWAGVKEVPVSSPNELLWQLQKGSSCRTIASTDINMVSSRSHAIFSVILKQTRIENFEENKENDVPSAEYSKKKDKQKSFTSKVISKFHFVDLACWRTNDRSKEGIAINGGLLALGNVINALGDKSRKTIHIPYRDSKLTRLLQDSLGGNSQTLMLACVSPAKPDFMETLNTLKYANRARNIKNKVSVNESYGDNSAEINQLRGQINRLKLEIQTLRDGGCSEEAGHKYEEEIKSLNGELGMTKMKLKTTEDELIEANTEKSTLLMEIDFNNQYLLEAEHEYRMKTHHIVQSYETETRNLKNQITVLRAAQADSRLSLAIIDMWIGIHNNLQKEKEELLEEHKRIITGKSENEPEGKAQALYDKIKMITSKINYMNPKILEAVRNVATEQENENHKQEKLSENSKDTDEEPRKNSKAGKAEKKPENLTPDTSYDIAVSILRSLDSFESQMESFFKDIVGLRTGDLPRQMTLGEHILELKKTLLLAMRKAAVLTTIEYEKKNEDLEKTLQHSGRSPSLITPETRELQLDDNEIVEGNRKLRRRCNISDKIEKANEQVEQGDSLYDDCPLSQSIKQLSTKHESKIMANLFQASSSVSFSEIQTIEVPTWQESNPSPRKPARRTSNSSRFLDLPIFCYSVNSTAHSSTYSSRSVSHNNSQNSSRKTSKADRIPQ